MVEIAKNQNFCKFCHLVVYQIYLLLNFFYEVTYLNSGDDV